MARSHRARADGALCLPQHPHADPGAHGAVRARHRRGDRHRREGDVLLRRPLRQVRRQRAPDAAPREHRRHRARRDRAQHALRRRQAAVVHRPDVPPREAAARALPPVPPDRRRGAGLRRAGRRCRADPAGQRRCGRRIGLDRRAAGNQQPGPAGRARAAPRPAHRALRGARRPARRRRQAPPAQQPAAHPRHQESGDEGGGGVGAEADRLPRRRVAGALRGPEGHPRRQRHRLHHQSAPGARPRLLQPQRLRVRDRPARLAGHGVRRRPLRRPDRADRRQARARGGLGASASSACSSC